LPVVVVVLVVTHLAVRLEAVLVDILNQRFLLSPELRTQ
jgi:hypothetical protein